MNYIIIIILNKCTILNVQYTIPNPLPLVDKQRETLNCGYSLDFRRRSIYCCWAGLIVHYELCIT